jgi:hypothetical protein
MLNAYNDASDANIPMEFRASSFSFQNGNVGIGVAPNATTKVEVNIINSSNITAVPPLLTLKNVGAAHVAKFVLGDGTTSDTFITHTGGNSVADQKFGIGINATNKFVLDGNGNVGIGEDDPTWMLDIKKDTALSTSGQYPAIKVNNPNSSGYGAMYFFKGATNVGGLEYNNSTNNLVLNSTSSLSLRIGNSPKLDISSGGAATFNDSLTLSRNHSKWYRKTFELTPTTWSFVVYFDPQGSAQYTSGYINITASAYINGGGKGTSTSRWYYDVQNGSISVNLVGSNIDQGTPPSIRLTNTLGRINVEVQSYNPSAQSYASVFVEAYLASGYVHGTSWIVS